MLLEIKNKRELHHVLVFCFIFDFINYLKINN